MAQKHGITVITILDLKKTREILEKRNTFSSKANVSI
jgi:hypothetical protein